MSEPLLHTWHTEDSLRVFQELSHGRPFQELLDDTLDLAEPLPNESWLDISLGGHEWTSALVSSTSGRVEKVVELDCIAAHQSESVLKKLEGSTIQDRKKVDFLKGDLSQGLPQFSDGFFDGVLAGLSLSFAQSQDPLTGQFNDNAFRNIFQEIYRVLKPGGRLVFSIHIPEVDFGSILWRSIGLPGELTHPIRLFRNVCETISISRWVKEETARGRFHYLSIEALKALLHESGFPSIEWKKSLAEQAFVIRVDKPLAEAYLQAA